MYYIPYPYYQYVPIVPYVPAYHQASKSTASNHNRITDQGGNPFVINIEQATENNRTFRTALWTGDYMQLTVMSIPVGKDIGLEMHPDVDQFLRIEEGNGVVAMGANKNQLTFRQPVSEDIIIIVPAGTWHNVINTGDEPLQLYSIYTPPEHPFGTVHASKSDAIAAEDESH